MPLGFRLQRTRAHFSKAFSARTLQGFSFRNTSASLWFMTMPAHSDNARHDLLSLFADVVFYCVAMEENKTTGDKHLHAVMKFSLSWTFDELRTFLVDNFCTELDLQKCKSLRSALKYISKEDISLLYNVSVDKLHFNFQVHHWASRTNVFCHTDPFIVMHRNCYHFIRKYYFDFKARVPVLDLVSVSLPLSAVPWVQDCRIWWNGFCSGNVVGRKRGLLLFGLPGVGKTTVVEALFPSLLNVFYPSCGRFFMTGFRMHYHTVIVFEEFSLDRYSEDHLKRLTEGRMYSFDVKYEVPLCFANECPVIYVCNNFPSFSDAMIDRLCVVHANCSSF